MKDKYYSIIISVFNAEEKISKTIESVFKQDKNLFELIIIDGKSADDTLDIIKNYKKKYPNNIKYISEPDDGIYDAMNKGIELAIGEYLYFIGAGDTLKNNILTDMKKYLKFKTELIYGNVYWERGEYIINGKMSKERICYMNLCHQSIFYHYSIFDIVGKYDKKYHVNADSVLNMKCFGNNKVDIGYIDKVIANYEGHGYSTIEQDDYYNDKEDLIGKFLGEKYKEKYLSNNIEVWLNPKFKEIINKVTNSKVIIFGASKFGQNVKIYIDNLNNKKRSNIEIKYFMDNSSKKWNNKLSDIKIIPPKSDYFKDVDLIIISSMPGKKQIKNQLLRLGLDKRRIISAT